MLDWARSSAFFNDPILAHGILRGAHPPGSESDDGVRVDVDVTSAIRANGGGVVGRFRYTCTRSARAPTNTCARHNFPNSFCCVRPARGRYK